MSNIIEDGPLMKDSSRSVSRSIGRGFRVESLARYAECSFREFIEMEKDLRGRERVSTCLVR